MSDRITIGVLREKLAALNKMTGNRVGSRAEGSYFLDINNSKYRLVQAIDCLGGMRIIVERHGTKRECFDSICTYMLGLEDSHLCVSRAELIEPFAGHYEGYRHLLPDGYSEGYGDAGHWYQIHGGHVFHHPTLAICRVEAYLAQ